MSVFRGAGTYGDSKPISAHHAHEYSVFSSLCSCVCSQELLPTTGGIVSLFGINFGSEILGNSTVSLAAAVFQAYRSVTVGSVSCVPLSWNDTLITCSVPEGSSTNLAISVVVDYQSSPIVSNMLSFAPPYLNTSMPLTGSTLGGTVIYFSGWNFGPEAGELFVKLSGPFGSYPCIVQVRLSSVA